MVDYGVRECDGISYSFIVLLSNAELTSASGVTTCAHCEAVLDLDCPILNYHGQVWHPQCFT